MGRAINIWFLSCLFLSRASFHVPLMSSLYVLRIVGRPPPQANTRGARDAMCTSVRENVGLLLDLINQSEPREDLRANELVVELIANVRCGPI
jgi:hypothetical protein